MRIAPRASIVAKKKASAKTAVFSWPTFLKKVSRDMLMDASIREDLPAEAIESEWLGYPGAAEKELAALEKRIKKRLPPSYRSFLETTNGWRNCGAFIFELWPCKQVQWFRKRNQDWIDAYCDEADDDELTDKDYFVYGKKQDPCRFRPAYLQSALEISAAGDSAILLLNPEVVDDAGEWEAWFFANWLPGATRYRSFQELMQAEHQSFLRIRKENAASSKFGKPGEERAAPPTGPQAIP